MTPWALREFNIALSRVSVPFLSEAPFFYPLGEAQPANVCETNATVLRFDDIKSERE